MYRLNIKIKVNQFKFNRVKFLCFLNFLLELTKLVRKLRYIISGVGLKVRRGVVKHSRCKSLNCFLPLCSLSRCNLTSPSTSQEQFWSTSKQFKLFVFHPPEWRWSPPYRFSSWPCSLSQGWAEPNSGTLSWISPGSFPVSVGRRTTAASSTRWCLMQGARGHAFMSTPSSRATQVIQARGVSFSLFSSLYLFISLG